MGDVIYAKSKMASVGDDVTRYYSVTLKAGMPMGLLLALTYPSELEVSSSKNR